MRSLRIHLFGAPRLEINGEAVDVGRRKSLAMLAYLAVTGQPHNREALAALLWPENDPSSALANLRRELSRLTEVLGKGVLEIDRQQVAINPSMETRLDVATFQSHIKAARMEDHAPQDRCEECYERLATAVDLYREDFLAGFTLPDCPAFDEWQFFQAEQLRQSLAAVLQWLARWHISTGEYGRGIEFARRWLAIDPLYEPAHRQLMQLYAWDGQHAAALRQYQECVRLLEEALGVEPEPETTALYEAIRLRKLPQPETAPVQESRNGQTVETSAPGKPQVKLPAQLTGFVGREKELSDIYRLLETEANCRLLTLIGPGGMGKTRLAIEAAARLQSDFPDGIYFVPLASINKAEEVLPATIRALDLPVYGSANPKTQLLKYLEGKQLLLILDNYEHLVNDAGLLVEILGSAAQVRLLVTSRERLNLQSEWLFEVSGMNLPIEEAIPALLPEDLEKFGATSLFLQRARQAQPNFQMNDEEIPDLVRVCRLVGGMPLALEIAAAWTRYMSIGQIADRIAADLDFLSTPLRDVPERHRSMRCIFNQTWDQLDPREQAVLRRLAVFQGGFQLQAAEEVAGADPRQLAGLADKALLGYAGPGRYSMHELIRQFALEKLQEEVEESAETRLRHSRYFTQFLVEHLAGLKSGRQQQALLEIGRDLDNVKFAWQEAVERRDVPLIAKSVEPLRLFSQYRARLHEGEAVFQSAREALSQETSAVDESEDECKALIAYLLAAQGYLAARRGDLEQGRAWLAQGIAQMKQVSLDLRKEIAALEMELSMILVLQGDFSRSEDLARDVLDRARVSGDRWNQAKCLLIMAYAAHFQGHLEDSQRYAEEGRQLSMELGDKRLMIDINTALGSNAILLGDFPGARRYLEEAVAISRDFNDLMSRAYSEREIARLELLQGNYLRAEGLLRESAALFNEFGSTWEGADALGALGTAKRLQRDFAEAERLLQISLQAAEAIHHPHNLAIAQINLGLLAYDRGDHTQAEEYLRESLTAWEGLNHGPETASVLRHLGQVFLAQGDARQVEAANYLARALQLAARHRLAPVALDSFTWAAILLARLGETEQAVELLALAEGHPSSTYETKERARRELSGLSAGLLAGVVRAARERGLTRDWRLAAEELGARIESWHLIQPDRGRADHSQS